MTKDTDSFEDALELEDNQQQNADQIDLPNPFEDEDADSLRFDVDVELAQLEADGKTPSGKAAAENDTADELDALFDAMSESPDAGDPVPEGERTVSEALLDDEFEKLMQEVDFAEPGPGEEPHLDDHDVFDLSGAGEDEKAAAAGSELESLTADEAQPASATPATPATPEVTPLADIEPLDIDIDGGATTDQGLGLLDSDLFELSDEGKATEETPEELPEAALDITSMDLELPSDEESEEPAASTAEVVGEQQADDGIQDILMEGGAEAEEDPFDLDAGGDPFESEQDPGADGGDEFDQLLAEFEAGTPEQPPAADQPAASDEPATSEAPAPAENTDAPRAAPVTAEAAEPETKSETPPELTTAAAAAAGALAGAGAAKAATAPAAPVTESTGKGALWLSALALVIAAGGASFSFLQAGAPMAASGDLEARISSLEAQDFSAQATQTLGVQIEGLEESLLRLEQQVNSESDQAQLAQSQVEDDVQAFQDKLATLEQSLAETREGLASLKESLASHAVTTKALQDSLKNSRSLPIVPATDNKAASAAGSATGKPSAKPAAAKPAAGESGTAIPQVTSNGRWVVNLVSFRKLETAQAWLKRFEGAGYPVELRQVSIKGRDWYRVRMTGIATLSEAKSVSQQVEQQMKLSDTWVSRR